MSALYVGFLFGVGCGGWTYAKMRHRTNSTQSSLIIAGVAGLAGFIIVFTFFKYILK